MKAVIEALPGIQNIELGKHCKYVCDFKHISGLCERWQHNRPADSDRVSEIIDCYKNGIYVPNIFHLAEVNQKLVCYDGNHRREALVLAQINPKVIIDIIYNCDKENIINEFRNLNKSVSVPEIFLDDSEIKAEIYEFVRLFCIKYNFYCKTSQNPQRPNFNRDGFCDEVYRIHKDLDLTIAQIARGLSLLNTAYKLLYGNLKPTILQKCKQGDLYLFAISKTIIITDLQQVLARDTCK